MTASIAASAQGPAEEARSVTVCQVKRDPAAYHHKLLSITGFVLYEFENFSLYDPTCPARQDVWLDYGGTVSAGTTYCCGASPERKRPMAAVVDGIAVPLITDRNFRRFDDLVHRGPDRVVRATVVGRFFSGEAQEFPQGTLYLGYGHLGCCSLLMVQQVVAVDPQDRGDLDYRALSDPPRMPRAGCEYSDLTGRESEAAWLTAQERAEGAGGDWAFGDPQRVAREALAGWLKVDEGAIPRMKQVRKAQGRVVFEWKAAGRGPSYTVVVSRPYWLSLHARDPQRVAWVVSAAYQSKCT